MEKLQNMVYKKVVLQEVDASLTAGQREKNLSFPCKNKFYQII